MIKHHILKFEDVVFDNNSYVTPYTVSPNYRIR